MCLQLNSRWTKFLSVTVPFVTRVVKDYTSGNIMKNEGELARDLRIVIEKLGPTFIKARFCSHSTLSALLFLCLYRCFLFAERAWTVLSLFAQRVARSTNIG